MSCATAVRICRRGRGYLPVEEAGTAEFSLWLARAEKQIGAGIDYCSALTNWRLRFATALPALIGARTIALLREAGRRSGSAQDQGAAQRSSANSGGRLLASASPDRPARALPAPARSPNDNTLSS